MSHDWRAIRWPISAIGSSASCSRTSIFCRVSARLENAQVPLIYARGQKQWGRAKTELDALGVGHLASRTPAQLSGGEQQRVAIARALVNEPLLLLADEPTGALDTATSKDIMSILERLNQDGLTILLVTHERQVAARANRIIRLRDGRVVADKKRNAAT